MSSSKNTVGLLLGTAMLTATVVPDASATVNPFQAAQLVNGYGLVNFDKQAPEEGKCGEGKCGEGSCGEKKPEGKCGEGKCGSKNQ